MSRATHKNSPRLKGVKTVSSAWGLFQAIGVRGLTLLDEKTEDGTGGDILEKSSLAMGIYWVAPRPGHTGNCSSLARKGGQDHGRGHDHRPEQRSSPTPNPALRDRLPGEEATIWEEGQGVRCTAGRSEAGGHSWNGERPIRPCHRSGDPT